MLLLYFLRANLTSTLAPVVQSKVRLRDQHIERDSYFNLSHIFLLSPVLTLLYFTLAKSHYGTTTSNSQGPERIGAEATYTLNRIGPVYSPDLLWCFLAVPMIVVWDEALLKTQSASWHTLANYSAYRLRRQRLPISSEIAPLAE